MGLIKLIAILGGSVFGLFFLWYIFTLIIMLPKNYKVSKEGLDFVKGYKLYPSNGIFMRNKIPSRFLGKAFFSGENKNKKELTDQSKMIGELGEQYFRSTNKYAREEVKLENDTWKGRADFIDKFNIYEIKTTAYTGYSHKYNDKWMFQLAIYLSLSAKHTQGKLIVYQYAKGSVTEKYRKTVNLKDYQHSIQSIEAGVSSWRKNIINTGIIAYYPSSVFEGVRIRIFKLRPSGDKATKYLDIEPKGGK